MRAGVERFARRWWAGELGLRGAVLGVAARPLSWAWAGAAAAVGARRAARAVRVEGLTVVSVGNLAVGGTGKTPLAAWIAERMQALGARPAVLVGGHARDEALLLARRLPDARVVENRDRVTAAREARAAGASVAILDDGFQHRHLVRDLDVVLLAAEDRFPGHVLPSGPYREGPGALARADAVLVTRRTPSADRARSLAERIERHAPGRVVGAVELVPSEWKRLDGKVGGPPDGDVVAVCAIARPEAFRSAVALRVAGSVELVAFSDHHGYTPADVARLVQGAGRRPLVTTEKDAVKLRDHADALGETYVLTERVTWDWGEADFLATLERLAALGETR